MGYCLGNLIMISGPTEMRSEQTSQSREKNDPKYMYFRYMYMLQFQLPAPCA